MDSLKGFGGGKPKHKALKSRTESKTSHKLHKTHLSHEYCRHCGKETSKSIRHESGHREYDCVDAPKSHGMKITG